MYTVAWNRIISIARTSVEFTVEAHKEYVLLFPGPSASTFKPARIPK